jgi:hypothetical protein
MCRVRRAGNLHAACDVRELETELLNDLYGHDGGNSGCRQGWSW